MIGHGPQRAAEIVIGAVMHHTKSIGTEIDASRIRAGILMLFMLVGMFGPSRAGATPPPVKEQSRVQREYAPYKSAGTAVITGQAFATTAGGVVKHAAGRLVVLNPVTWYTTEFWWKPNLAGEEGEPDPSAMLYAKTAVADAEGRFSFEGLPAGSYFALTDVSWVTDPTGADWYVRQYGTTYVKLGAIVTVKRGQRRTTILNTVAYRDASTSGKWTTVGD